jgi:hypothetical protein
MPEYKLEILKDQEVTSVQVSDRYELEIHVGPVGVDNGGQPAKQYLTQAEYDALPTKSGDIEYNIIPG